MEEVNSKNWPQGNRNKPTLEVKINFGSNGKESACHAGDQGSIPGLESSQWQSTPEFLPGEFHGQGTWWATVCGVAKSQTRLNDKHTQKINTCFTTFYSFVDISFSQQMSQGVITSHWSSGLVDLVLSLLRPWWGLPWGLRQ